MGQVCDRNCANRCTVWMLPAPYPSLILGPGIFLASFLLPWSPQKQVLQPPAQLSQPRCRGSTPSSKGMLSSLRAGHRAGILPRSISPAALALWHLLLYLSPPKRGGPLLPAACRWSQEGLSYRCCRVPAGWRWQAPQGWERLPLGTEHAETTSAVPQLKNKITLPFMSPLLSSSQGSLKGRESCNNSL